MVIPVRVAAGEVTLTCFNQPPTVSVVNAAAPATTETPFCWLVSSGAVPFAPVMLAVFKVANLPSKETLAPTDKAVIVKSVIAGA